MTRPKVLLVDDSALVRAVVAHSLTDESLELASIDDPRKLAEAVERERPALLLVDATFPGVSEDMFAELVLPHAKTCPIVLFSDRPEAELAILATRVLAVGTIPKDAGGTLGARLRTFLPA